MKLLLVGSNGQVGFELQGTLGALGDVIPTDSSNCNLVDETAIRQMFRDHRPDIVINSAAYSNVDKAESEPELAQAINAHAPSILAEEAKKLGAMMVHYSTDYVFDGTQQTAYLESDVPNPINVYGLTKLAGEQAIAAICPRHLILRTSWVVGAHGSNFAKTILRLASERDTLSVVSDQIGVPTSASMLANVTTHLIRQAILTPSVFPYGLYHAVASGETNWYAYACHVIERARKSGKPIRVSPDRVRAIKTFDYPTPAKRPTNSRLDTRLLRTTFGLHLPEWEKGVDHVLDQIL